MLSCKPVAAPLRITSPFGERIAPTPGASTFHQGIDLGGDKTKPKTAILAVKAGTVTANYYNKYRGWVILIRHTDELSTLYQHLVDRSPLKVGERVYAGQIIGTMGASGVSAGVHLHFEVRRNGYPEDPLPWLKGVNMTREDAKKIIQERCEFEDKTIAFLESYLYRDALLIKIATAILEGGVKNG